MATATALSPRLQVRLDTLVLANRPLNPRTRLADTSRFGDDKWDLSPAIFQTHQVALTLNFLTIPAAFRQVTKELLGAILLNDLPDGEPEVRVATVRALFTDLKQFFAWAHQRGITDLHSIGHQDIEDYGKHLGTRRYSHNTVRTKRKTVRMLWTYRSKLHTDALSFDPHPLWSEVEGPRRRSRGAGPENATDRIPEQVLAPLLRWALRWVEDFADDILRAQDEWIGMRSRTSARMGLVDGTTPLERVTALLADYRAHGRPLPRGNPRGGYKRDRPPVNVFHLCRQANVDTTTLIREPFWGMVTDALEELGLDDSTYVTAEVQGRLDGRPWLRGISYDDVTRLTVLLQTACYIVIAYLSGMRDAEVKHMKRGCLTVMRDENDRPVRYKVTSQAFKGEDTPAGVQATWVVHASVATAVRVLERMQPSETGYLFAYPPASRVTRKNVQVTNEVTSNQATIASMARLIKWINSYCADHGRHDDIPTVNGKDWRLTTRQFRRTLAWHIARQPGGSIAGAIQYRHHSLQMFEGYAGTSESGFRHEVEAEAALARGEQLGDIIRNPSPQRITGPAAEEAEARLAALESEVHFHGKVITDTKRLARYMKRHDPHIYPGEFVTCVHNPDRALCRRDSNGGPSLADCQPFRCRNVALTEENTDALLAWLKRLEDTLAKRTVLAPYLRHRLEERRTELITFLQANDIPTHKHDQETADAPHHH